MSNKDNCTTVEIDFKSAAKCLGDSLKKDLVDAEDLIRFGRNFNIVHFEGGSDIQQALQEGYKQIS